MSKAGIVAEVEVAEVDAAEPTFRPKQLLQDRRSTYCTKPFKPVTEENTNLAYQTHTRL